MRVISLVLIALLSACAPLAFETGSSVYVEVFSDNEYQIQESPNRENSWLSQYIRPFPELYPPNAKTLQAGHITVIERRSGCKVRPDTVITQSNSFVLWAEVEC